MSGLFISQIALTVSDNIDFVEPIIMQQILGPGDLIRKSHFAFIVSAEVIGSDGEIVH